MSKTHKDIKIRKNWGSLNPVQRIHSKGKKDGYDRKRENRDWRDEE